MASFDTGPYVAAATFCDRVLHEQDGVLSLIRMVSRLTILTPLAGGGASLPGVVPVTTTLALCIVPGQARGKHAIRIDMEKPSGVRIEGQEAAIYLDGPERIVNLVLPVAFLADEEGLYWFHARFDGDHLTSVPLQVLMPQALPGRGGQGDR